MMNAAEIILGSLLLVFLGIVVFVSINRYKIAQQNQELERLAMKDTFQKTLLQSQIEIQEQTLHHISQEIHDNVSQLLFVMNASLATIDIDKTAQAREKLAEAKATGKQVMAELRAIAISLNTDRIMHIGLEKALENELERMRKSAQYTIEFNTDGEPYRLTPEKEIILFRICQESLNNILKHAEATTISVVLHYTPVQFALHITDNGKGFNTSDQLANALESGSTGLRNLQNRSALINASLTLRSEPGVGTTVTVVVPVTTDV
jgi:signal transduction histidine kinase